MVWGVENRWFSVVWGELVALRSWNFGCGDGVRYSALGAPGEALWSSMRGEICRIGHVEEGRGGFGARREVSVGWQFERERAEVGVL